MVQIRASKIPYGLCNLRYEKRLKRFNIISLRDMSVRGNLIEMYNVLRGLDEIEWTKSPLLRTDIYLTGPAQGVRVNRLKLGKETFQSRIRNSFAQSVIQRNNLFANRVVSR